MIIGLVGRHIGRNGVSSMGAGKSTVARMLAENHNFVEIALADPLKRICKDVFGFSREQLWGPSHLREKPNTPGGVTPRAALQSLGTEWGRALDEDIWVRRGFAEAWNVLHHNLGYAPEEGRLYRVLAKYGGAVIPDIRFRNEVAYLQKMGAKIWVVQRTVDQDIPLTTHQSEVDLNEWTGWDMVLDNHNGPLEELEQMVSSCVKSLACADAPLGSWKCRECGKPEVNRFNYEPYCEEHMQEKLK